MWLQVQESQQEEVGQTREGEVLGQIQEGSSLGTNPLPRAWPIPFPCHPGWTSLPSHCHCLHHTGRGTGGRDKEAKSEVYCLAQEAKDAEKWSDKLSNWVHILMDQRHDGKADIWRLEQELKRTKEELTQLKVRKSWRPLIQISC